jgi:hypothetical protein
MRCESKALAERNLAACLITEDMISTDEISVYLYLRSGSRLSRLLSSHYHKYQSTVLDHCLGLDCPIVSDRSSHLTALDQSITESTKHAPPSYSSHA